MNRWLTAFAVFSAWPLAGLAQTTAPTTPAMQLPTDAVALPAIGRMPEVQQATATLARAEADARLLGAGSHEATLNLMPLHRTTQAGPGFHEWEASLTRAVRWPGKARLDREIGAAGVDAAQLALADSYHIGARRLLTAWTGLLRAQAALTQRQAEVATWERDRQAIARRMELGDAANRDLLAADAALAQARGARLKAEADLQAARLALRSTFPNLPLPTDVQAAGAPPRVADQDQPWNELIVARSHDIGIAEAVATRADATARRARADRLPDLTVGVRVLDELGGRERAVGLVVSIPLGIRQRSAQAAAAGADALQAEAELAVVRRDITHDADDRVLRMRTARAIWEQHDAAWRAASASAGKTERAYTLGESSLAELLVARRTASDAALAERGAAIDAVEAAALVRIDAHDLWHYHAGEGDDEEHPEPR